jgi:hypothetical protein
MKKFSKITGETITEQKPVEIKVTESDLIKAGIMKLMDNYLSVRFYGPVTRYQVAGSAKVVGKEIFLGALLDMLEEFSTKEKVKLLESMKSEITDWELLDNKIDQLNEHINEISESKLVPHKEKIKSLCSRYSNENELLEQFDKSLSKIKSGQTAYLRAVAAKKMISENQISPKLLLQISDKYLIKASELGYTK